MCTTTTVRRVPRSGTRRLTFDVRVVTLVTSCFKCV